MGASSGLAEATDRFNRAQIQSLADLVRNHAKGKGTVGILGITYKPDTDVVEESFGLLLARELSAAGGRVVVFDPQADTIRALGTEKNVQCASSARECIAGSDVVVLATPWQQFRELPAADWARRERARTVIDAWRVLSHLEGAEGIRYVRLGFGGDTARIVEATSGVR